jgi:hypothetical protein
MGVVLVGCLVKNYMVIFLKAKRFPFPAEESSARRKILQRRRRRVRKTWFTNAIILVRDGFISKVGHQNLIAWNSKELSYMRMLAAKQTRD